MTESLQGRLAHGAESGVYRLSGRAGSRGIADAAKAAGWQFHQVDASASPDKAGLLAAAAEALHFPGWAGHNWDAFEELVSDLSWLPAAPGHVLLIDRLGPLAGAEPEELRTLLDVLETAAANRRDLHELPLIVLLRGAGQAARRFEALTAK